MRFPNDLEKAKALIKDYGKPVEFKMLVTATPRGRTIGQVLQQFWKRAGANMEIEQVDQATIPPRAFMRQFQLTPWRIVDLADPDIQMYANFKTGSPVALANYSNPELDKLLEHARVTADQDKRIEDYCAISAARSTRRRSGSGPSRTPTTQSRARRSKDCPRCTAG